MNLCVERKVDSDERRSVLSRLRQTVENKVDDLKFARKDPCGKDPIANCAARA